MSVYVSPHMSWHSCKGPCGRLQIDLADYSPRAALQYTLTGLCVMCGDGATYESGLCLENAKRSEQCRVKLRMNRDELLPVQEPLRKKLKRQRFHKNHPNLYALVTGRWHTRDPPYKPTYILQMRSLDMSDDKEEPDNDDGACAGDGDDAVPDTAADAHLYSVADDNDDGDGDNGGNAAAPELDAVPKEFQVPYAEDVQHDLADDNNDGDDDEIGDAAEELPQPPSLSVAGGGKLAKYTCCICEAPCTNGKMRLCVMCSTAIVTR